MTVSDKDLEDYARDCVRLARLARDPTIRDRLMQMARDWMAEATHESKAAEQPCRSVPLSWRSLSETGKP
jgi:hypothetical protein